MATHVDHVAHANRCTGDSVPWHHGQRRYVVTQSLIADILHGRLVAGQRLVIADLAARYDVSPTPVRESLVALEGLGLIDAFPNRGAVLRRLTETDAREICQVRRALECEAVQLFCQRSQSDEFSDMDAGFRRIQTAQRSTRRLIDQCRGLDSQFHDRIADGCGNRLLTRELQRLAILIRGFRDAAWQQYERTRNHARLIQEATEHLAIVGHIRRGDAAAAAQAMAQHIDGGLRYWIRALPPSPEMTTTP